MLLNNDEELGDLITINGARLESDEKVSREEKLEVIADILEVEEVEEDNVLEDFETWDSIAVLSVISVITEETGLFPHANEIKKFKTVSDIMKAIGD